MIGADLIVTLHPGIDFRIFDRFMPQPPIRMVARVTSKHGRAAVDVMLQACADRRLPVMLDINHAGGKGRLIVGPPRMLAHGQRVTIGLAGTGADLTASWLPDDLCTGASAVCGDYGPTLVLTGHDGQRTCWRVVRPGTVYDGVGFLVLGHEEPLTLADAIPWLDLAAGAVGVESVALSFAESFEFVQAARAVVGKPIVAKVESAAGIEAAEEMVRVADLMGAGGDLFAAVGHARFAHALSRISQAARARGRRYFAATSLYEDAARDGQVSRNDARAIGLELANGASGIVLTGNVTGSPHFEAILKALEETIRAWTRA